MIGRRQFLGAGLAMIISGDVFAATPASDLSTKVFAIIDAMDVESKWPAGVHVDWLTGIPDGKPIKTEGKHTHCSAFVAAAAKALGIYVLRPPEHSAKLLANAQNEWLLTDGASQGCVQLKDMTEAQDKANEGYLVLAAYHNHKDDKPGHIAIIRPGNKDAAALAAEGPDVTQAGGTNFRVATLVRGFAGHPKAWANQEILYFAHAVDEVKLGG